MSLTSDVDEAHPGKLYVHLSLYVDDLTKEERDGVVSWVRGKFDV